MLWLRKSKKGFTLIELMVVVAIIGILALLGLRLFLMQQVRAKNAIVKANTATVHTIIQGNLADITYGATADAVNDIRDATGTLLTDGNGLNSERPAGMKNPHLTGDGTGGTTDDLVVNAEDDVADAAALLDVDFTADVLTKAGMVVVAKDAATANKFYVIGLDNNAEQLGEVYIATK
jgi:prepilin-type N-terminal cleavage/methylation domain-containing protein